MAIELVVTEPFGLPDGKTYMHGDVIDAEHVEAAKKEFARHFVRRAVPDPEPVAEEVVEDVPSDPQPAGKKAKGATA